MLPWVIDMARAVRATILTNLIWAFGYNIIALESGGSWRSAADPRGSGHGRIERPGGGEFAAAGAAAGPKSIFAPTIEAGDLRPGSFADSRSGDQAELTARVNRTRHA